MSKSDKIFNELGYKKCNFFEEYRKETDDYIKTIFFDFSNKKIRIDIYNKIKNEFGIMLLTMQELQAINKKVKELGWLDE